MRTASLRPVTILPQNCTARCTKLRKHFNAIMEVIYCFTVAIGLPGDASDYNEDKRSAVACKALRQWCVLSPFPFIFYIRVLQTTTCRPNLTCEANSPGRKTHFAKGVTRGVQFLGRRVTIGGAKSLRVWAEKSQHWHKYFLQYNTFASERTQFRTWGRQTCFLPRRDLTSLRPCILPIMKK